jgi:hypothetical protein
VIEKRLESINGIPNQIVLLGEALFWCKNVDEIIKNKSLGDFSHIMYAINLYN